MDQKRARWGRLIALAAVLVGLLVAAKLTGVSERITVEGLRATMQGAGATGIVLFLLAFCAGLLLHIPGWVFVGAAVLAYGKVIGALLSFVGANLGVACTFLLARGVGGKPLEGVERPLFRRVVGYLNEYPFATVVALRVIFWMNAPISYTLSLSGLPFRHYMLGSAIGLVVPVILETAMIELFLQMPK